MRNRNNIIAKTILKLAALNPKQLVGLIQDIETSSSVEFIYGKISTFLRQIAKREDEKKVVYERLMSDKFLQTTPHKDALRQIGKEFPFLLK